MTTPIVVEVVRSGAVESTHLVDVAVVDRSGAVVARSGDPLLPASFRSAAKPIQARVAREAGWQPMDDRALAIACASHSGAPEHLDAVRSILTAMGIEESFLRCPSALPLDPVVSRTVPGEAPIQHNCSGKHAAMLAACAAAGWDLGSYRDPGHPLQQRIRTRMEELLGPVGAPLVDGCGVPTYVAPLAALARAFLATDDGGPETAAMRAHPALVGGRARTDTDLMRALPRLVAKGGAEALLCVTDGQIGIALKVRDGAGRAVGPAAALVLDELEFVTGEAFEPHRSSSVLGGGERVGSLRAHGTLGR